MNKFFILSVQTKVLVKYTNTLPILKLSSMLVIVFFFVDFSFFICCQNISTFFVLINYYNLQRRHLAQNTISPIENSIILCILRNYEATKHHVSGDSIYPHYIYFQVQL